MYVLLSGLVARPGSLQLHFVPFCAVEDLLMWRDPTKSGIVFGATTVVYLVIDWSGLSTLDILMYLVFLGTLGSLLWNKFGHMVPNL